MTLQKLNAKSGREIVIDPVTRIEGHAKITIQLDASGKVEDAHFHVTQVRGFEKFCEGRPFTEMPSLMARICGICPVSHLIASAKACDALLAVRIPETAAKLRQIMNLAQIVQSHALSFFYLSSPDFLLGMDADPAQRNIIGMVKQHPQLAKDGIRLRQIGQTIIEILGGKRIHPAWIVPGGVNDPLTEEERERIVAMLPEAQKIALQTIEWFGRALEGYGEEIRTFANFRTLFLALVNSNGELEHYDGKIRITDADGNIVRHGVNPEDYREIISENVEPWTYLKFTTYAPQGYPGGIYRVGPLARLNAATKVGTPLAEQAWREFTIQQPLTRSSSFHYHFARLVEILYAVERIQELLDSPNILSSHVRAFANPNSLEGIGVSEAPRGTLIHHYKIDENGLMQWANLIIATGHNNLAMNKGVLQVAQRYVDGAHLTEGMLNRVEAVIRAYDPCLSCSTHAIGQMPLHIELVGADGSLVDEIKR
ncbi:MAG: Ni/Fe hydrogenase subunit alpha [Anaerolineae bacterium]|nr:Ni/Fe hydrogenase subunit alpha [Anaerolineae bacterium]